MRSKRPTPGAALLLALACQPQLAGFSERQLEVAERAAARVRPALVAAHVRNIYEARLTDSEPDFAFPEHCPPAGCAYSRVRTAELIREVWRELPPAASVREQRVERDGLATTNLFVDIPSARGSEEWVLAVAHYDAWFGAANDNATGVAVTLESAFALSELQLDKNVRLLLTDGEELGLVGAERYVEEFGVDGLSLVLNADMIAHRGSAGSLLTREPEGTEYIAQANDAARREAYQLAELARHLPRSVELRPVVFPDDGVSVVGFAVGAVLSDHAPFWLRGIKAVFPFPAGDKPSFYHTPDDTPDKVDWGRLERMSELWAAAIAAFATSER